MKFPQSRAWTSNLLAHPRAGIHVCTTHLTLTVNLGSRGASQRGIRKTVTDRTVDNIKETTFFPQHNRAVVHEFTTIVTADTRPVQAPNRQNK